MPLIGIRTELEAGRLQIIHVQGLPLKSTWNLIWLKGRKLSPVAEAFLKFIEQKKDEIIKNNFYQIS
jgi:DNA-binding transcriptional LysR family regulator